jgi:photosystem II stability/assembly factor-like uncharacterized protein
MSCASSRRAAAPTSPTPPAPTEIVESEGEIQRARELWEERQHRTRSGVPWREIETENRRRNLEARAGLVQQKASDVAPVHWRERGSFDQSGRTRVTEVGSDGETLFVGTDHGGVFSGTPGGEHWAPRSDGLGIGIQSFVIVPGQPEVWLAIDWYGPLYMSANQGVTWSPAAGIPREDQVERILRDRGRPRTAYALADGWHQVGGTWKEMYLLYRSDDGGLHFNLVSSGQVAGPADLWIDRVHGGTLYLATSGGLAKSTDAGVTFSPVGAPAGPVLQVILTGSEAGAPTFYAAVNRQGHLQWELVVSEDGGRTWQERGELRDFWGSLTASITDAHLVFVGGMNAHRSTDAGRTFTEINQWYDYYPDPQNKLHADLPGIDCAIYHGKEAIFFDTDGGTFLSDDGGRTVRNITRYGLGNSQYYGILTSRNDTELIAAGAQDQGYQISHPGSGSVLRFDQILSGDYGSLTSSDGTHDMLYSAYPGFLLLQTREGERTLESFDFPVPREQRRNGWIPALAADPDDPNVVYYADRRIWRVQRTGPSTATSSERPQDFGVDDDSEYVSSFAISPLDRNRWLAGTTNGWIWRSHDGGQTWTRARSGLSGYVADLLPSPTDPDLWYAAGNGYVGPAVVRTTNGGETWEPWSTGLPQTLAKALAFDDPVRQDLYVATEAGPFHFDTQAATWISLLGTEAPLTDYRDVEGIPDEGVVRFATYGRGIWDYSPTGGLCVADDQTFCFLNGRFEVKVAWKDFANNTGVGHVVPGSGTESGLFWFFQPANWELMVKVLDGCSYNNRFWVFSAATTTVEYTLRVRDTQTGQTNEYKNRSGAASPAVTDTGAFSCSASAAASAPTVTAGALPSAMAAPAPRFLSTAASAGCADTATTLCLSDRFRLEMTWRDSQNRTGSGQLASLRSSDSGIFWFFSPTNWETLTKIVNGCELNGHYWVFGAALTNVEYTLRVTDTVTGEHREYFNPLGVSSPTIADTSALRCN